MFLSNFLLRIPRLLYLSGIDLGLALYGGFIRIIFGLAYIKIFFILKRDPNLIFEFQSPCINIFVVDNPNELLLFQLHIYYSF